MIRGHSWGLAGVGGLTAKCVCVCVLLGMYFCVYYTPSHDAANVFVVFIVFSPLFAEGGSVVGVRTCFFCIPRGVI